jgi:Na+-transporting methylmalonyl-CoA/oxaloacetate decarboxylase gamma subunit
MSPALLLAATATERIPFLENLNYQAVGMVIVMGALGFLAVAVAGLGRAIRALEQKLAAPVPVVALAVTSPGTSAAAAAADDPKLYAAIIAAVSVSLGARHRVISVTPTELSAWSVEGRRSIFQSHRVR